MNGLEISILCPTKIKENTDKSVFFLFYGNTYKFTCKGDDGLLVTIVDKINAPLT